MGHFLKRSALVLLCAFTFFMPSNVLADYITASVAGSTSPSINPSGDVVNGDFLIKWDGAHPTGDGIDEATYWTFDFTLDPNFSTFSTSVPLQSAQLTLTLTPKRWDVNTDTVRIGTGTPHLPNINTSIIQSLPVNTDSTVYVELLDFYTSDEILNALNGAYPPYASGNVPMAYFDDAIVSYAQLDLQSVPIPPAVCLLGSGLIGLVALRKRFKK